jgi:hypothetical protein
MELPFLIMTPVQAANFRDQTRGAENQLDPVLIRGGQYVNRYALPSRVKYDPAHADKLMALTLLTEVSLDIDEAFPQEEEE